MTNSSNIPESWPEPFRRQLALTQSHAKIIEKIGIDRATIGIFETFSMVKIPKGFLPIMAKIGPKGNMEIEQEITAYEGQTKELSNYSIVAVKLAIKLLPGYEKTTKNIRKVIRVCTGEVLTHTALLEDIQKSAVNMARPVSVAPTRVTIEPKTFDRFVIDQDKVDHMNSKPIDWETSHWWSGE